MNEQDDLYYLQPGFDLSSLTIPRLRSIFVAHDITYPSSAKKQELVELLQQELVPKARKLLSAQARVKRTSRGITDIPSSQGSTLDDDDETMPPPPPLKTPRSRRSKSNLGEEASGARSVRKSRTPSGRSSTRTPASDNETAASAVTASAKRTRKGLSKMAEPEPRGVRVEEPSISRPRSSESSPFTDENPFQSGSSPLSGSKRVSSVSRSRLSTGSTRNRDDGERRLTRSPQIKQEEPEYSRNKYILPVGGIDTDRHGINTGEEFTPEQEQELQQELTRDKQLIRTRNSALTRHEKTTSTPAKLAPLGLLTIVIAAIGGWYRQEKINIGYCGVGESHWSLASNANIPAWVHENIEPQCEVCPQHAICFPNLEASCEPDFILQPHPLSLNGLVPLPPTCEPDSDKERRIKAVADRAIEELRERRAVYECGDSTTTSEYISLTTQSEPLSAHLNKKLEISEEALKQQVSKLRRKGMSDEMFEDLWQGAFADVISRNEVEVNRDGSRKAFLSSNSLAQLPFTCAVRRSFIRALSRIRGPLAILILILGGLGYGRKRLVTYNQAKAQTPSLVAMTLDRLATQAALKENDQYSEGFISVAQLRDDVLRNVLSTREREHVWERVKKIVEQNSNVRAATREGKKTGEWSRVWEWIGPTDANFRSSTSAIEDSKPERTDDKAEMQVRRWNEGRPIY